MVTRITALSPTVPVRVPVPTPLQVTVVPPEVSTAPGLPSVTVEGSPSTSVIEIVPVAVTLLVVSVAPVVSALAFARPSSETVAAPVPTTGASLVPLIVIVSVVVLGSVSPSVRV